MLSSKRGSTMLGQSRQQGGSLRKPSGEGKPIVESADVWMFDKYPQSRTSSVVDCTPKGGLKKMRFNY